MALESGTRLGPYEVLAAIGAGGMGEVYRARDTKLDRDVALKILPDAFTNDAERLARFEREAKVLAALNHPNIGAIHGLEDSGENHALVLELVEGPTLADRIAEGPIPIDEALPLAKQIAEALEAAHEQGIIHRDLKPANIKLRPDGTVKVLDFGLAKLHDAGSARASAPGSGDRANSPTLTAAASRLGVIMGTAAYMSPEQARGKAVDRRADIWGFGVVLYEMLTGQRAFEGEDVSLTLADVMRGEPKWERLPDGLSPAVSTYLRRCIVKDPRQRVQAIGDVRLAMEGAFETMLEVRPTSNEGAMRRGGGWPVPLAIGVTLFAAVTGGLAVWATTRPTEVVLDVTRLTIDATGSLTVDPILPDLAVSPDGGFVVYTGWIPDSNFVQLHLRPIDQLAASPLRGTRIARGPFVSPDGQWIGFSAATELRRVAALGGPAVTLASLPFVPFGGSWGQDAQIIVGSPNAGLFRVSGGGGGAEPLTTPPAGEFHRWPFTVANGRAVLFARGQAGQPGAEELAVLSLDTGEVKNIGLGGSNPRYVQTGHLVYAASEGSIRAVRFDLDRLEVTGSPVRLVENAVVKSSGAADFGVSDAGRLVYLEGASGGTARRLVWVSRNGEEEPLDAATGAYFTPRVSPDGMRVAVDRADGANEADIWILDLSRGTETKLTTDAFIEANPLWTPDGTRVVYGSAGEAAGGLFWKSADGTGEAERFMEASNAAVGPAAWSADGTTIAFWIVNASTDIGLLAVGGDQTPSRLVATDFMEQVPTISPDGGWIAYESDESGLAEIYVQRFPELGQRVTVSSGGGRQPVWSRDGDELFYRAPDGMMAVPVDTDPTFSAGAPELLFEDHYYFYLSRRTYDVAPDGQRFLMVTMGDESADATPLRMVVVEHWDRELLERLPVRE